MRRLGKPLHQTPRGDLILRVNFTPRIGSKVVNKEMREVGQIFDIFGPVKTPYVSVKPQVEPKIAEKLVDEVLYEFINGKKQRYSKKRRK
ncbi:MAG: H/ACA ribonucleoprotein complex subunit GAR1 [Candidatus Jordarchaeum sp.]|uniref:H/ACA ribonucleoprotein complex subunit GAR1 n=1 Tax=Candidatus Jordarchaeum sp. TaxID=2823881 RepID=UPI00404B5455